MFGFFKRKKQPIVNQLMDVKRQNIEKKNEVADKIIARFDRRHEAIPVIEEKRKSDHYERPMENPQAV